MSEFTKGRKKKISSFGVGLSLIFFLILAFTERSQAQLYPLGAQYYDNQYLGNPAMAGMEQGMRFNLTFRKQWTDIPGSPVTQNISGDVGINKVGLGINIYNDSEGLLHNTRIVGTFAYHLPLNTPDKQFHFGLSVGFIDQRLRNEDIVGDPGDPSAGKFNDRQNYVDGDFGMSYTSNKLSVQASVPNMKSFFRKDFNRLADLAIFYTAASYKMSLSKGANAIGAEPKICFRGVQGFDNMWDAGANFSYANNRLNFLGLYHSTASKTFGFGFNYNTKWRLSSTYTTATKALKGYTTTGNFEVNIKITL